MSGVSGPTILSIGDSQELAANAEVLFFKYPEAKKGPKLQVNLHAPFMEHEGILRPVIQKSSAPVTDQECEAILSIHALFGHEIRLNKIDGEMGRPALRPDTKGAVESAFGDDEGKEAFTGFSLIVAMDGTANFLGYQKNDSSGRMLEGVSADELYGFGKAVLDGIDIHRLKQQPSQNT